MNKRQFLAKQSLKLLRLKLDLERPLVNDLTVYFRACVQKIKKGSNDFEPVKPLLKKHQGRIINVLLHKKKKSVDLLKILNDLFICNEDRIQRDSLNIDKTTLKKYRLSIDLAKEQLNKDGLLNPSYMVICKVASTIFKGYSPGRIKEIAITETNGLIESSRKKIIEDVQPSLSTAIHDQDIDSLKDIFDLTESWNVFEILDQVETSSEDGLTEDESRDIFAGFHGQKKIWVTMGDDLVRTFPFDHDSANGQEQFIDDPFVVSGELLQFPGDWSLGASLGNLINCRCSALY